MLINTYSSKTFSCRAQSLPAGGILYRYLETLLDLRVEHKGMRMSPNITDDKRLRGIVTQ